MGVPGFLKKRMEKTGGGYTEYITLRTQLGTVALFAFSVFLLFSFSLFLLVTVLLLFFLNFYSVFKKSEGIKDIRAYQYFFGGLNLFGLALAGSTVLFEGFEPMFSIPFLLVLALFLFGFYIKFRKNFVFGEVLLADEDWAVVRIPYDLCSGTKSGFYAVRSKKGLKKGDEVKIEVAHAIGERRMPWRVID